jgi:sugar O-acyltransferase (sialic acid O-acetyltransferase NeuD family)
MQILILGAGGHAKVVADIVRLQGHEVAGFLDDNEELIGRIVSGVTVLDRITAYQKYPFDKLIFGIGNNRIRQKIHTQIFSDIADKQWFTAIHPRSIVADSVTINVGTVVMAGAVINADTVIQQHVIVNTGATIDHDNIVQSYAHIAPGVNLAGGVRIETGALIGIGSCVIPLRTIGAWATVGAGATVIHDVPQEQTVIGTPAHPVLLDETE